MPGRKGSLGMISPVAISGPPARSPLIEFPHPSFLCGFFHYILVAQYTSFTPFHQSRWFAWISNHHQLLVASILRLAQALPTIHLYSRCKQHPPYPEHRPTVRIREHRESTFLAPACCVCLPDDPDTCTRREHLSHVSCWCLDHLFPPFTWTNCLESFIFAISIFHEFAANAAIIRPPSLD